MATLTFYGGIGTSTGTKFAIEQDGYRAHFDLGLAYLRARNYWDGRVLVRPDAELRDLIAMGPAPGVDGIYRADALAGTELRPGDGEHTALFLSHLHLDHSALLRFVADEVPVYLSAPSAQLLERLDRSGWGLSGGHPPRLVEQGTWIEHGPLRVGCYDVDHDLPGAMGFVIQTDAGVVAYSGDLRLHGIHPERVDSFVEEARRARPLALVVETTRAGEDVAMWGPQVAEADIPARLVDVLRGRSGLALCNVYPHNLERLAALVRAARELGREAVLEPEFAALLPATEGLRTYATLASRRALVTGALPGWKRELLSASVTAEDLRRAPDRYLLQLSYRNLAELIDLQPPRGSLWTHSNGEPLGAYDPAFLNMKAWLDRFEIDLLLLNSSGHASEEELRGITERIAPRFVFPVHGLFPERLAARGPVEILPRVGQTYVLRDLS
jgi:ribonuclease J